MAQTVADIKAGYEADPQYASLTRTVNGEDVALSAAERDAKLTEWAVNERQRQLDEEAEAARKAVRDAAKAQLARMDQIADFAGSSNNTLRDAAIKDLADFNRKLARILIQRGVIEP